MNKKIKVLFIIKLLVLTSSSIAQIKSDNFAKLVGSEPVVEINLGATMLSLLSSATEEEAGISAILSSLKAINVTVFEIEQPDNIKAIRAEISKQAKLKAKAGFKQLATIKDEDSLVYILAKMDGKKFESLTIFALDDDDELVLINIQGTILVSQIGNLMDHFDVDLEINTLKINKHNKKGQ
ncbi:hypothetical protein MNBD_GAMMA01-443 [hydrothermal vent metagenome]|uniref:DUF4252 domain-containing protein n=1 Tax=hydrothermal vent metagenome TaxID=652676 RepID=A0A3B0VCC3_9ZZZZ